MDIFPSEFMLDPELWESYLPSDAGSSEELLCCSKGRGQFLKTKRVPRLPLKAVMLKMAAKEDNRNEKRRGRGRAQILLEHTAKLVRKPGAAKKTEGGNKTENTDETGVKPEFSAAANQEPEKPLFHEEFPSLNDLQVYLDAEKESKSSRSKNRKLESSTQESQCSNNTGSCEVPDIPVERKVKSDIESDHSISENETKIIFKKPEAVVRPKVKRMKPFDFAMANQSLMAEFPLHKKKSRVMRLTRENLEKFTRDSDTDSISSSQEGAKAVEQRTNSDVPIYEQFAVTHEDIRRARMLHILGKDINNINLNNNGVHALDNKNTFEDVNAEVDGNFKTLGNDPLGSKSLSTVSLRASLSDITSLDDDFAASSQPSGSELNMDRKENCSTTASEEVFKHGDSLYQNEKDSSKGNKPKMDLEILERDKNIGIVKTKKDYAESRKGMDVGVEETEGMDYTKTVVEMGNRDVVSAETARDSDLYCGASHENDAESENIMENDDKVINKLKKKNGASLKKYKDIEICDDPNNEDDFSVRNKGSEYEQAMENKYSNGNVEDSAQHSGEEVEKCGESNVERSVRSDEMLVNGRVFVKGLELDENDTESFQRVATKHAKRNAPSKPNRNGSSKKPKMGKKALAGDNSDQMLWRLYGKEVIQVEGLPASQPIDELLSLVNEFGMVKDYQVKTVEAGLSVRFKMNSTDACVFATECLDGSDCIFPDSNRKIICQHIGM